MPRSASKSKHAPRRRASARTLDVRPEDRAVLTTGANSGFGLVCALEIARRGYRSIGTVRSEQKAEVVARAAAQAGVDVETVLLDVTDADACAALMEQLPLYGLVNNAGYAVVGAVEDVPDEHARDLIETMTIAPMRLARLAIPGMRERGEGRIICMSSMYGRSTIALNGWYQAAKHGLEGVADALRVEVASAGIDVVLVEPGMFNTGITDDAHELAELYPGSHYETVYQNYEYLLEPIEKRSPGPEAVAKLVGKILDARSPRSRYLVGADAYLSVATELLVPTAIKDRLMRLMMKL